ncbi:hypothetical protein BKA82DRAFT_536907 [Pisolithus tinctorius]|uniref:Uncharacterized protein n=1 Tax=Pisolithus tinctorius Marx 270 TaxID=870435 RepID=A0A0C3NBC6_PISTI|nr:hypothetical protein BKA82DRAFT_536907 [Pisolithus tinctorius]KIN93205.1 hypothetical protein M404DRAFT_536907 [Pisolithus tinctorius Marx 270]
MLRCSWCSSAVQDSRRGPTTFETTLRWCAVVERPHCELGIRFTRFIFACTPTYDETKRKKQASGRLCLHKENAHSSIDPSARTRHTKQRVKRSDQVGVDTRSACAPGLYMCENIIKV